MMTDESLQDGPVSENIAEPGRMRAPRRVRQTRSALCSQWFILPSLRGGTYVARLLIIANFRILHAQPEGCAPDPSLPGPAPPQPSEWGQGGAYADMRDLL